eukprot:TRINITY_DN12600_c0_g1_i1.p1 TRINITY_DN12600_c0_g1~~TRINITY_DN12600_c0_g1_i1.p1  ORF type:complete len:287 (-),score=47.82 TRINITY_DN12600_c0_g1_i1:13-831(-)
MASFLTQRCIGITTIVILLSVIVYFIEDFLKEKSGYLAEHGMLDYNIKYSLRDVYGIFDSLGHENLQYFLVYLFADTIRAFMHGWTTLNNEMASFLTQRCIGITTIVILLSVIVYFIEDFLKEKSGYLAEHGMLDYNIKYSLRDVYGIFDSLGHENLQYFLVYLFADTIRAFMHGLMLLEFMYLSVSGTFMKRFDWLPVVVMASDYFENILLFYLAYYWPDRKIDVVKMAAMITGFKISMFYLCYSIFVFGVLYKLIVGTPDTNDSNKEKED